jgi:hypothetical protein
VAARRQSSRFDKTVERSTDLVYNVVLSIKEGHMAKRKSKPATIVTFLLDRTGSMEPIADDTIGAFNAYVDTLKAEATGIEFSLLLFDSQSLDKIHVGVPVGEVPPLTRKTYIPRATTPLIDAAYKTIKAMDAAVSKRTDTPKIVICIQTDGQENSSTEHTWIDLNALIKEKTTAGWQFIFMGVGLDAYEQGAKMGIIRGSTVAYNPAPTPEGARMRASVFTASARNTAAFAAGRSHDTAYSLADKLGAGDQFDVGGAAISPMPVPTPPKPMPAAKAPVAVDDFSL